MTPTLCRLHVASRKSCSKNPVNVAAKIWQDQKMFKGSKVWDKCSLCTGSRPEFRPSPCKLPYWIGQILRELEQRRRRRQPERRKINRYFFCRRCTTTTWTFLDSRFVEDMNARQQLKFCQHLTNLTGWNKRDKVWSSANSLFKWRFRCRRRRCCSVHAYHPCSPGCSNRLTRSVLSPQRNPWLYGPRSSEERWGIWFLCGLVFSRMYALQIAGWVGILWNFYKSDLKWWLNSEGTQLIQLGADLKRPVYQKTPGTSAWVPARNCVVFATWVSDMRLRT